MRVLGDDEPNGAVVIRGDYLVHVRGILAVEEHKESPLVVMPTSVQLDEKSVRLPARDEVVVNANALAWHQLVDGAIDSFAKPYVEYAFRLHS